MISDTGKNVGEVELRVEAIKLGGFDQRVHGGGAVTAGVRTSKEIVLPADRNTAQGALGRIVVESQAAIIEAPAERGAPSAHVTEGCGKFRFARQFARGLVGPEGKRRGHRLRTLMAFSS